MDADAGLDGRAQALEASVGHPGDLWQALKDKVQGQGVRRFRDIEYDWLALVWTLDAYRRAGVPPLRMGNMDKKPADRLAAVYRMKGNYFAELAALLLENRTGHSIRPRTKVRGFSQLHQIDLAWPSREINPLICAEAKVTGAPAYGSTPSRAAMGDFSNRRKELKFTATDLKLWRRQDETSIDHWSVWRASAEPKTYFLWGARLRTGGHRGDDNINRLVDEAQVLVNTYLEGAGIFAWRDVGGHYESVPLPLRGQVTDLDDVLYRIESEIKLIIRNNGAIPPPQRPAHETVDVTCLASDEVSN